MELPLNLNCARYSAKAGELSAYYGNSFNFYQLSRNAKTFNEDKADCCWELAPDFLCCGKTISDVLSFDDINGLLDDVFLRSSNGPEDLNNILVCLLCLRG